MQTAIGALAEAHVPQGYEYAHLPGDGRTEWLLLISDTIEAAA